MVGRSRTVTSSGWTLIALVVLGVLVAGAAWLRCEGTPPAVEAPDELVVGRAGARVPLGASDAGSGVRRVEVRLRHAGGEALLAEQEFPGNPFTGGALKPQAPVTPVDLDPHALGLAEGGAFLSVEARDWSWAGWLAGNATRVEIPVRVDLTPPRIAVESGLTYVERGGTAAVVYRLDDGAVFDGVAVGDARYAGHPLDRGDADPGLRGALFAVARDAPGAPPIRVLARDAAGNEAFATWPVRLRERRFDEMPIALPPSFLEGKVVALASQLGVDASDPLAAFREINSDVRAENEARIREIVARAEPERLFHGPFEQLRSSAVTSRFAEHRTYLWRGEPVSEAIHYGFDLASTAHAVVGAGNAGRVLHAGPLGIYGDCVILDHGLGLTSLYAHLSRIDVAEGAEVSKGEPLGLSGATGLAGGDHLHFAILVGGTYVDPVEWWDGRWVRDHVEAKLGP